MKIEGPRSVGASGGSRKSGGANATGFALPSESAGPVAAAAETRPAAPLDSVLALQTVGFDPQRRGREAKRGARTLDALEALARAHLEGAAPNAERLTLVALQKDVEQTGDPGLDAALEAIDVRAAVELAKLEMSDRLRQRR